MFTNAIDAAVEYLRRGWAPIPIPWREKIRGSMVGRSYASPLRLLRSISTEQGKILEYFSASPVIGSLIRTSTAVRP